MTVAKAYRLLKAVLATAVDDELIRRNPCRIKGAGNEPSPERRTITIEQVYAIARAVRPWFRALVLLAAFTGLRWGELLFLRRRHLDLDDGIVKVRGSLSEVGGQLVEGPPKSAAGRRDVAIPEAIVSELRAHLDEWSREGADGRVFVGPQGATPRRGNFQVAWSKAVKKAGVPALHFHDLRHTGNTLAAEGASLRELGEVGAMVDVDREASLVDEITNLVPSPWRSVAIASGFGLVFDSMVDVFAEGT